MGLQPIESPQVIPEGLLQRPLEGSTSIFENMIVQQKGRPASGGSEPGHRAQRSHLMQCDPEGVAGSLAVDQSEKKCAASRPAIAPQVLARYGAVREDLLKMMR